MFSKLAKVIISGGSWAKIDALSCLLLTE